MLFIVDVADQRAVGTSLQLCKGKTPAGAPEPWATLLLALPEAEREELANAIRQRADASRRAAQRTRGASVEAFEL